MKNTILFLALAVLTGCAGLAPITDEDIRGANFGAKPSKNEANTRIKSYLNNTLIDPDSVKLSCSDVYKGWAKENYVTDSPKFGYIVVCNVNAKNRFGGYTGAKEYVYIFNGNFFQSYEVGPYKKEYGIIE